MNGSIGFLATGDELTEGDILNTNGQVMARALADEGFAIGTHVVTTDQETDIHNAINFLMSQHAALIITGGLGPTSDDRTRNALSAAIQKPLIFDSNSWQNILDRFTQLQLEPHPANKQQAFFPEGAEIIPNPNGTAPGCSVTFQGKLIFMLPGPPRECVPMFKEAVLPALRHSGLQAEVIHKKWRLFGVSEGEIGAKLDTLVAPFDVVTGYRWDFPYLEFKIRATNQTDLVSLLPQIEAFIAPYRICTADHTAAEMLRDALVNYRHVLTIRDQATGGLLETQLLTPNTKEKLQFVAGEADNPQPKKNFSHTIAINGLTSFWQGLPPKGETNLELVFTSPLDIKTEEFRIPYRNAGVLKYAVEIICFKIYEYFKAQHIL